MKSTPDASLGKASPRWLRFRLRTLLVFMVLLSFGFGWLGNALLRIRRQRSIVAMIEAAGGTVTFEHERYAGSPNKAPPGPRLVRNLLGDDALARVTQVKLVQGLREESCVSDADLRLIAELSTLKTLQFDGQGFKRAPWLPWHERFQLDDTHISNIGLARLSTLDDFEQLLLTGRTITDDTLSGIAVLEKLEVLSLERTDITARGLEVVRRLPNLRRVNIRGARSVDDQSLQHFAGLKNLQYLSIYDSAIGDRGLVHLGSLDRLTVLQLESCNVADAGLEHLASLPNLRTLSLARTHVTDKGLAHLVRQRQLTHLNLRDTQITDQGLPHLAALPNLQSLALSAPVTAEGAKELQKQLPNCRIDLVRQLPNRQVHVRLP